jgi:hypothetical protein
MPPARTGNSALEGSESAAEQLQEGTSQAQKRGERSLKEGLRRKGREFGEAAG